MPSILRRSVGRAMHGIVLRHAFKPAELSRLLGPWEGVILGPDATARPTRGDVATLRGAIGLVR